MADLVARAASHPRLGEGRLVAAGVAALFGLLLISKAVQLSGPHVGVIDFECFHLVGRLVAAGRAGEAWSAEALHAAAGPAVGDAFMPWTYPPQFAGVVALFAGLPLGVAYALFVGPALAAFLWVLRRAAGERFGEALLLAAPVIAVNIACGQNGLITGALGGAAALGLAARRPGAGWPLGALILKPHLAIGLGVGTLAGGRRETAARAAAVVLASSAAATLLFGPAVWPAFLGGVREAGAFLREGLYPLHRMASAYTVLRSAGVAHGAALAVQAGLALLGAAATAKLMRDGRDRAGAGFALLSSGLASPYLYDYDLTLFVLGLVMLWPELEARMAPRELAAVKALTVSATLYGLAAYAAMEVLRLPYAPSLAGAAVVSAAVLVWRGLNRPPAGAA